jgi:hypothetical protein
MDLSFEQRCRCLAASPRREGRRGRARYKPLRCPPNSRRLREVDFVFDGNTIRGLEQNPETKSRWAEMARSGIKVMQFLSGGRYVANVVDAKVTLYGRGIRSVN